MPEETKKYIDDELKKNVQHTMVMVEHVKLISENLDKNLEKGINKYVNGKIDKIHQKMDEQHAKLEARNVEQDADHEAVISELSKIQVTVESVDESLKFLHNLKELIVNTGMIVASIGATVGAFWAFMKFVIFNSN